MEINQEKVTVRLSVRSLVEFVLRSGDIDSRSTGAFKKDAMAEGRKIHKKIQKSMGTYYRAEVPLSYLYEGKEIDILTEGRADGIEEKDGITTIDEIKGVYLEIGELEKPIPVHLAQAKCYGYFYGKEKGLDSVRIQLTYCQFDTEEIRRFVTEESMDDLERFYRNLMHEYMKWAEFEYHHKIERNRSIRPLEFPFPYREGQRDLAVSVYRTISRGKKLFLQAPTGIGKTLSTVFPAVKAVGEEKGDKIFYLTAKTVTRMAAEEAFRILRGTSLVFSTVTITAKEKICPMEKADCNPETCPYAKGHFDRVNDAVFEILHKEQDMTADVILQYAERYQVCPFEFSLDISSFTDGIICDYNYVFDPNVRLKRYFSDEVRGGDYIFLIDEAHNLVSRAREMYSAEIQKEDVLAVRKIFKDREKKLEKKLTSLNQILLLMKREEEGEEELTDLAPLYHTVVAVFEELEAYLSREKQIEERDTVLEFFFCLRDFMSIYENMDDHYRVYSEHGGNGSYKIRLFCINPARNLSEIMEKGISTILFSATMLPVRYYKTLLSGDPEDYAVYADSPFPAENRLLMIASDVTSRYTRRNEREYRKIASYIKETVEAKAGNYLIFFPSYQFMEEVISVFEEGELPFEILVQYQDMTEEDRKKFLDRFEVRDGRSLAGFCVTGGIFSEGIDLTEDRLIGVVIVGTGLPMVCQEQEVLRNYFEETEEDGFDFSYRYPGMNKILQAAGRVIRTPEDRGIILLLDERFLGRDYQQLFPREWDSYKIVDQNNVKDCLRDFWKEQPKAYS